MKRYSILALALVLTAATLVGCGCTNRNMDNATNPTVLPTNEEIWNSTEATTHYTTESTMPHVTTHPTTEPTRETYDNGNGGIDNTLNTEATTATEDPVEGRARRMMPGTR